MEATATTDLQSIKIEDIQPGHRYVRVVDPRFEDRWTVATVEQVPAAVQVLRDGAWTDLQLVRVTYRDGRTICHEVGTVIGVDCDELGPRA